MRDRDSFIDFQDKLEAKQLNQCNICWHAVNITENKVREQQKLPKKTGTSNDFGWI